MSSTDWIPRFRADPKYGHLRLKRIAEGYPPHAINSEIIDVVDPEVFLEPELQRIAFFVGTQFGLYPKLDKWPHPHVGQITIAILGKSMLSGNVAGLTIREAEFGPEGNLRIGRQLRKFRNRLD